MRPAIGDGFGTRAERLGSDRQRQGLLLCRANPGPETDLAFEPRRKTADGCLDEAEEKKLSTFASRFDLSQEDLDSKGAYGRVIKGSVLRELMNGRVPQKLTVDGDLPFNFQKAETLIWLFPSVKYYEDRSRRQYVGTNHGVSVRIAKGIYYRVGAFNGHPIETTETIFVAEGPLGITNKHIYFSGGARSFRIRHDKVVTIQPYDDGVALHRDAQTAKRQIFATGDGWFTYNLLANVPRI